MMDGVAGELRCGRPAALVDVGLPKANRGQGEAMLVESVEPGFFSLNKTIGEAVQIDK